MKESSWCVITGAPSSGKTTLINALGGLGYPVAQEVARSLIEEMLSCNLRMAEIRQDLLGLQRKILSIKLRREKTLDKDKIIFFDRGVPDSIAYFRFYHLNPAPVFQASRHVHYRKIFYCEPLPFVYDGLRTENDKLALELADLVLNAYTDLGYEPIILPVVSVEERLAIITKHL